MEYGEPHCELRQIPVGGRHIESIIIIIIISCIIVTIYTYKLSSSQ